MRKRNQAKPEYIASDGTTLPGVTTILGVIEKPGLHGYFYNQGRAGWKMYGDSEQAADIGTIAHGMIEADIKGEKLDLTEYPPGYISKAENCLVAWWDWRKANEVQVIHSELKIMDERMGFGGTLDLVAQTKNGLTLIDIKTSKAIYDENIIQVAAYDHLWQVLETKAFEHGEDNTISSFQQHIILRLDKVDGIFEPRPIPYRKIQAGWKVFLGALEVYKGMKELKG
jgi:hypothetical protein